VNSRLGIESLSERKWITSYEQESIEKGGGEEMNLAMKGIHSAVVSALMLTAMAVGLTWTAPYVSAGAQEVDPEASVTEPQAAQGVRAVYFEDLFGQALSYVLWIDSQGTPIGARTHWFPQQFQDVRYFVWSVQGNTITLAFNSGRREVLQFTRYEPSIDVWAFTRFPESMTGYWIGCRSPYIPKAIPPHAVSELCALVGVRR
jgi:hypothetical protein